MNNIVQHHIDKKNVLDAHIFSKYKINGQFEIKSNAIYI